MAVTFSSVPSYSPQAFIPGPVDRVSFFAEQARNRRATWRLAAACGLAIVVMGIPISIVLTPFAFALALAVAHTLDAVFISTALEGLMSLTAWIGAVLDYFLNGNGDGPQYSLASLVLAVGLVLLPGMGTVTALWFSLNSFFRHAGVGGVLMSLGAREPRIADLEEQQLTNLVTEMALAAGVPSPRVMLLDAPVANAAAIGSSPEDATIIVSRRVLDECDREETQGIIGHLVGSIGNGDLRIAFLIGSVFLTFGLLTTLLNAPFGPRSRAILRQLFDLAFRPQHYRHGATEAESLSRLLTQGLQKEDDDLDTFMEREEGGPLFYLLLPVMLTNLSVKMTLFVFMSFLVGPLIALLWRSRCHLADTTAVQLTRNPDGVARGLQSLASKGAVIPGSQWVAHLFIVGAETANAQGEAAFGAVSFMPLRPPLGHRFERLRALGATVVTWRRERLWDKWVGLRQTVTTLGPLKGALIVGLLLLLVVLIPIAVVGLFVVVAMLTMVSLMIMGLWMMAIYGSFSFLGFLFGLFFA